MYFNSLLKNKYSENIKFKSKKKSLIAIIDNASHTPTYIHIEFLLYLKSLNFNKNFKISDLNSKIPLVIVAI